MVDRSPEEKHIESPRVTAITKYKIIVLANHVVIGHMKSGMSAAYWATFIA